MSSVFTALLARAARRESKRSPRSTRTRLGLFGVCAATVFGLAGWRASVATSASTPLAAPASGRATESGAGAAREPWPPFMNFFPDGGAYTADDELPNDSLAVTIIFCDDSALVGAKRNISFNATNVTSQFTYETLPPDFGCGAKARSEGKVRLVEGANKLKAQIGDGHLKAADSTIFTYQLQTYGVEVGAKGRSIRVLPSVATSERFVVKNTGSTTVSFTLAQSCVSPATSCSAATSTASLAPGAEELIPVSFTAAASGSGGQIKLTASRTNADGSTSADSAMVTVDLGSAGAPTVSVAQENPGPSLMRDRCVTLALGSAAAAECGDLRIVHALPSTRSLSRDRTPVLLYNSGHAAPSVRVAARVDMPSVARPDEVEAILTVNGVPDTLAWSGLDWGSNAAQRIMAVVKDVTLATGVYPYTLAVQSRYGTNEYPAATVSGQIVVVNRSASPFGSGWWLAGLEQLVFINADSILWVGGDGSTRVYAKAGTDRWLAPQFDRVDSLRLVSGEYVRFLPSKLRTVFDLSGNHVRTVNRLGHVTRFLHSAGKLDTIIIPVADSGTIPSSSSSRRYAFGYSGNWLTTVTAPPAPEGARVATLSHGLSDGRVTAIQDPDLHSVSLGYIGSTAVVRARTDRRGTVHAFGFDLANRVATDTLFMQSQANLVKWHVAAESRGAAVESTQGRSVHIDSAFTRLDGARTDVNDHVTFWTSGLGNVTKIRNALGDTTIVTYGNSSFPALPTQVRQPNGLIARAAYNARGLIDSSIVVNPYGTGADAVTTYEWGMADFDTPTAIVGPLGDTLVKYGYNTTTGNRESQQDARGTASAVEFRYWPSTALLRAIEAPNGAVDSLEYDARGNLAKEIDPLGRVTSSEADVLGRPSLVVSPIDTAETLRRRFVWDLVGQLEETIDSVPAMPYTLRNLTRDTSTIHALQMRVVYTYDDEGNQTRVQSFATDLSDVTTDVTTTFDRANRVTAQDDGKLRSFTLDPAGNPVQSVTANGKTIKQRFDALNRPVRRTTVSVWYPQEGCFRYQTGPLNNPCQMVFPYYPNDGTGLRVSGDTATFAYDVAGNLVEADNRYARIRRGYFPNGQLKADTLKLGLYTSPQLNGYVRHQQFAYDLLGRRTSMVWELGTTSYAYHDFGPLERITDPQGNTYHWSYNALSQVDSTWVKTSGGTVGVREHRTYYDDGSPHTRVRTSAVLSQLLADSLRYDHRGKVKEAFRSSLVTNQSERASMRYDGLGALLAYERTSPGGGSYDIEEYRNDAFGNVVYSRSRSSSGGPEMWYRSSYAIKGELMDRWNTMPTPLPSGAFDDDLHQDYGNAGLVSMGQVKQNPVDNSWLGQEATRHYYDGEDRLAYVQRFSWNGPGAWEEYRYDALGRRIMTRARREGTNAPPGSVGLCTASGGPCRSYTEWVTWDGDSPLVEWREAEGTSDASNSGTAYHINGPELDRPLAIRRDVTTHVINYNWRGLAESSVTPSGAAADRALTTSSTIRVRWPSQAGAYFTTHYSSGTSPIVYTWLGSLVENGAGASGMLYRRNRYFDPQTGRFTQEDPIGLAGGLNGFGFADGDPVNFGDPFGLCPWSGSKRDRNLQDCPRDSEGNEDKRTAAFRLLMADSGPEGNETVDYVINNRVTVELTPGLANCGGDDVQACAASRTHMKINGQRSAAAIASFAMHEETHMSRDMISGHSWEEALAWRRSLDFYDRLAPGLKTASDLNRASASRRRDPNGFVNATCTGSRSTPCRP